MSQIIQYDHILRAKVKGVIVWGSGKSNEKSTKTKIELAIVFSSPVNALYKIFKLSEWNNSMIIYDFFKLTLIVRNIKKQLHN